MASPPAARISATTRSAPSLRMSATTTFAPSCENNLEIASPKPLPPPVTMAIRPCNFMMFVLIVIQLKLGDIETQVLYFEIVCDAISGAFSAETRLLDTAKRRDLSGDESFVDADHAIFKRLGHT